MLASIFELVQVVGGFSSEEEIIAATSVCVPRAVTTAFATSSNQVVIRWQREGSIRCCVLPWTTQPELQPKALAFSPTAEQLLVAVNDGSLYVVPLCHLQQVCAGMPENSTGGDATDLDLATSNLPDDVLFIPSNGSRAKPSALVWWQPSGGDVQLGIVGTVLGELCVVELSGGKEVGGTYIPRPVAALHICTDNSMDLTFLLITDQAGSQFRLVLEQRSAHYLFPLENLNPDWYHLMPRRDSKSSPRLSPLSKRYESLDADADSDSLPEGGTVMRSRLQGIKQLSVEKLASLRRSLSDAKQKSAKKPVERQNESSTSCGVPVKTESVDSAKEATDVSTSGAVDSSTTATATQNGSVFGAARAQGDRTVDGKEATPDKVILSKASDTKAAIPSVGIEKGLRSSLPSSLPEPMSLWLPVETAESGTTQPRAASQYSGDRYLLSVLAPSRDVLRVYSAELASSTPLHVYQLVPGTAEAILLGDLLYCRSEDASHTTITVIATCYAASARIDGDIGNKVSHIIEELELPEHEEVLHIFPSAHTHWGESSGASQNRLLQCPSDDTTDDDSVDVELPEVPITLPNGCLIVTKKAIYVCQTRESVERLFLETAVGSSKATDADRIGTIFSVDSRLYELAADANLKARRLAPAFALYKQARCSHARCAMKFAWAGLLTQFVTYTSKLLSGDPFNTPEMTPEDRQDLATLTVLAYLVQLCAIKSTRPAPALTSTATKMKPEGVREEEVDNKTESDVIEKAVLRDEIEGKFVPSDELMGKTRQVDVAKDKTVPGDKLKGKTGSDDVKRICEPVCDVKNITVPGDDVKCSTESGDDMLGITEPTDDVKSITGPGGDVTGKTVYVKEVTTTQGDTSDARETDTVGVDYGSQSYAKVEGGKTPTELGNITKENEVVPISQSSSNDNFCNEKYVLIQSSQCTDNVNISSTKQTGVQLTAVEQRIDICSPDESVRRLPLLRVLKKVSQSKSTLATLLLFLKNNQHYDPIICMCLAAESWRWETVQYLSTARGLMLEKLAVLLTNVESPVLAACSPDLPFVHSCFDFSSSLPGQHLTELKRRLMLDRSREPGYLHCLSDPELRTVLLVRPRLARIHATKVLQLLPSLSQSVLHRLASMYDPSHAVLVPFLRSKRGGVDEECRLLESCHVSDRKTPLRMLRATPEDEPFYVEDVVEVFLKVLIRLNELRGHCYQPALVGHVPVEPEQPKSRRPRPKPYVSPLCCGYGCSAVIVDGCLYTWGFGQAGVLGHGVRLPSCNSDGDAALGGSSEECFPLIKSALLKEVSTLYLAAKPTSSPLARPSKTLKSDGQPDDKLSQSTNNGNVQDTTTSSITATASSGEGFSNNKKQLVSGGKTVAAVGEVREPLAVTGLSHVTVMGVACGHSHMLAITPVGIYGWGNNMYGQVGTGSTGNLPRPTLLTARSLLRHSVVQVACGQYHSLAVTNTGRLFSWGWNVHGQLGVGSVEDGHTPALVWPLAKKASAGYAHSVCLDTEGCVYAWGCGVYGQCGTGGLSKHTTPRGVLLPTPVTHLTAGYFHNVCVTNDHRVYTWGSNPMCLRAQAQILRRTRALKQQQDKQAAAQAANGEQGKQKETLTPELVYKSLPSPCKEAEEQPQFPVVFSSSDDVSVACEPLSPQSPSGLSESRVQERNLETRVQEEPSKNGFSGSDLHAMGTVTFPSIPVASSESFGAEVPDVVVETPPPSPSVKNVSGSSFCNSTETEDDISTVPDTNKCHLWRRNSNPQTNPVPSCDPDDLGHLVPVQVLMPSDWGTCLSVSAGTQHTALLTTHGALYVWGRNLCGQLGTGGRTENLRPVRVLEDVKIVAVECGADHTVAIDDSGRVLGWGSNFHAQLAKGPTVTGADDKGQPGRVFTLRTSKRILKVPQSMHSNVETPRQICGLPPVLVCSEKLLAADAQAVRLSCCNHNCSGDEPSSFYWLQSLNFASMEERIENEINSINNDNNDSGNTGLVIKSCRKKSKHNLLRSQLTFECSRTLDSSNDGGGCTSYGLGTLQSALSLLRSLYSRETITDALQDSACWQPLAALHLLHGDHCNALKCLLKAVKPRNNCVSSAGDNAMNNVEECNEEVVSRALEAVEMCLLRENEAGSGGLGAVVEAALHGFVQHRFPLASLERLLLQHLPTTVYPLAVLLFGNYVDGESGGALLKQLSTKFCVNLCAAVIEYIHAGVNDTGRADVVERLSALHLNHIRKASLSSADCSFPESHYGSGSALHQLLLTLERHSPGKVTLSADDAQQLHAAAVAAHDGAKDVVAFSCGHHFLARDFTDSILPGLQEGVSKIPGLLGNTARVLLAQYDQGTQVLSPRGVGHATYVDGHRACRTEGLETSKNLYPRGPDGQEMLSNCESSASGSPVMACPRCVLAHLLGNIDVSDK